MKKPFVYGKSVDADNFTDRQKETKRLLANFCYGMNTIIISPRRMGKTSLVRKVQKSVQDPKVKVIYMDVYDCRSEYDFLNRFASVIIKETAGTIDKVLDTLREFLSRVTPRISYSPEPLNDFQLTLGITPRDFSPEEILNLPEVIAQKRNINIVVCIDEFQQIGEFPDSVTVQKRMRGVWQHQKNTSYCMFGSKNHMMMKIFQNKRMPFFMFGEMMYLDRIPKEEWIDFITEKFQQQGKKISRDMAARICDTTQCHSSYVQQLSWNVLLEAEEEVTEQNIDDGICDTLEQNSGLFQNQIADLTSYQMNFLRAICSGYNSDFTSKVVTQLFDLGAKSNIYRIKNALLDCELIAIKMKKVYIADPIFEMWFKRDCM